MPVSYPTANPPQAWAAGAMPYLLETLLGLVPEGLERRLRIVRPLLPDFVDELEARGLRVGAAKTDLRFTRRRKGETDVDVLDIEGQLGIHVEST